MEVFSEVSAGCLYARADAYAKEGAVRLEVFVARLFGVELRLCPSPWLYVRVPLGEHAYVALDAMQERRRVDLVLATFKATPRVRRRTLCRW